MEYIIILLITIGFSLIYFNLNKKSDNSSSNEFLLNLNENLRKEIQEVRKRNVRQIRQRKN